MVLNGPRTVRAAQKALFRAPKDDKRELSHRVRPGATSQYRPDINQDQEVALCY